MSRAFKENKKLFYNEVNLEKIKEQREIKIGDENVSFLTEKDEVPNR